MTNQRVSATPSTDTVANILDDMTFPAARDQVLQHAQNAHAGELIIAALNRLPNRTFDDLADLLAAYKHERTLPPGASPPSL